MKTVYGYIRVSTKEQGETASLPEQKFSIQEYAKKNNLNIISWYEEKKTAAKRGRPLFTEMMDNLKEGKADGVVMHKIDRSARNLHDWAAVGDLIDTGIDVHFAHESLDMTERGGRLTADIQAVMASDYIRNLKQEIHKGLYGRLKQGIYPFSAPIGYRNNGGGNLKTIDPIMGPKVYELFQLYSTGNYNLVELAKIMNSKGLRNINGNALSKNGISAVLNNPFYTGVIRVKGQIFKGNHKPIIEVAIFNRIKLILTGKVRNTGSKHNFLFRRILRCEQCGHCLPAEFQKGRVYYRCHSKNCITKSMREDFLEHHFRGILKLISLSRREYETLSTMVTEAKLNQKEIAEKMLTKLHLDQKKAENQLSNLLDAFLENLLNKEEFNKRKLNISLQIQSYQEEISKLKSGINDKIEKVREILELCKSPLNTYDSGIFEEKRDLIEIVTSNLLALGRKAIFTIHSPFKQLAIRDIFSSSGDTEDSSLTMNTKYIYSDINTSPILPNSLKKEECKIFLDLLLQNLDSVNNANHNNNAIPTNHTSTK